MYASKTEPHSLYDVELVQVIFDPFLACMYISTRRAVALPQTGLYMFIFAMRIGICQKFY